MKQVRKTSLRERSRGICYYNHGTKHLARLLVSLYSLRRHYSGPVTVLDTGESGGLVERIAGARGLGADVQTIPHEALRRNSCYVAKAGLWRHSPYSTTVLLDADTVVARDPAGLFCLVEASDSGGVVVTRFSDWVTTGSIVRGRIERWRGVRCPADNRGMLKSLSADELVEASLEAPHAAINTGVICWAQEARGFLRDWERLTRAGWRCPLTDELAAQNLIRRYRHTLVDDRYNCSPIYGVNKSRAVIWHAHGSKHCQRADERGQEGHKIWWPVFAEVWRVNLAGVQQWAPAGDGALAHCLASGMAAA